MLTTTWNKWKFYLCPANIFDNSCVLWDVGFSAYLEESLVIWLLLAVAVFIRRALMGVKHQYINQVSLWSRGGMQCAQLMFSAGCLCQHRGGWECGGLWFPADEPAVGPGICRHRGLVHQEIKDPWDIWTSWLLWAKWPWSWNARI